MGRILDARRTLWRAVTDQTGRVIVALGALMLAAYLAATILLPKPDGRVVFGDATHYFVQLRSMVFDHDLDFRNEYTTLYGLKENQPGATDWLFTELTDTGHVRNYMPVGPALLWAPLYLIVAGIQMLLSFIGLAARPDGFGRSLQMVPGAVGVMAATWGAWLSWRLARRDTDAASAAIGVLAVWLGSHALYYSLVSPSYSHAASMLTSAWFFSYCLSPRSRDWNAWRSMGAGALAGLSSLMRWQDVLFLAMPIIGIAMMSRPWPVRLRAAAATMLAWSLVFSPQMMVWRVLYGHWLAMPQGPSFLQWTSPHPFAVLLSDNHGLFSWTPLIVLAVIGLVAFLARHRQAALPIAVLLLGSWYVNAAVADWWAGEAFGARRFLSLFPLFVVGLAVWLQPGKARRARLALVGGLVAANWLLLLQYEVFMKGHPALAPYPTGWFNLWIARFIVPFRLL
jgi:hypothetical protein